MDKKQLAAVIISTIALVLSLVSLVLRCGIRVYPEV